MNAHITSTPRRIGRAVVTTIALAPAGCGGNESKQTAATSVFVGRVAASPACIAGDRLGETVIEQRAATGSVVIGGKTHSFHAILSSGDAASTASASAAGSAAPTCIR